MTDERNVGLVLDPSKFIMGFRGQHTSIHAFYSIIESILYQSPLVCGEAFR